MSVLIKGMEMPTRCGECSIVQKTKSAYRCPLASKANGFSCVTNFGSLEIPEYCPLIEVPEHRCFEWIPVTERFPEKEGLYIVWVTWNDGLPDYSTVTYFDGDVFSRDGCVISHWMPLPEPPKEEHDQ